MLKFHISYAPGAVRYIDKLPENFEKGSLKGLRKAMFFAEGASKKVFAEGGPVKPKILTARTGHLRRRIKGRVMSPGLGVLTANVAYGILHEIVGVGKAKVTRPFLLPALSGENLDKIREIIKYNVVEGVK